MPSNQTNAALISFLGLTAMAVGAAMWLFPLLPAITAAGSRPQFSWSPWLGLGILIAGMAILTASRLAERGKSAVNPR